MKGLVGNGAQVVASCDVYKDRREAVARQYQARSYHDFRELLARDDIDAVLNATPEHWHAIVSIEACRNGKDVYCEKPLAFTVREAQATLAAARRYDRVFQTGSQQRSDGHFRFACELVRNGYIGEVKRVVTVPGGTSRHCNLPEQPIPPGLDWDMWLGPSPWAPYHQERCVNLFKWWNWRDYSGGLMTDRGAHDFDIVQWGLGADGSGPVEIVPPKDDPRGDLVYHYPGGAVMHSGQGGWGSNGKPGAWASSVIVCHVGNIAYWLNRPLRWNPAKQEFPGDQQANRLLGRPMREPYCLGMGRASVVEKGVFVL
jgi:predicted dehydrogenase